MSVQQPLPTVVEFALKAGGITAKFRPESRRQMISLVKNFLAKHGARARAVEMIKAIDSFVSREKMVYLRELRKLRSQRALDCAMFINNLPGTDEKGLGFYNLVLADLKSHAKEGSKATRKVVRAATEALYEEVQDVVDSDVIDAFKEMRKNGGRYTKAIAASRKARLKAAQTRKQNAEDRRSARRAWREKKNDRRFEAFLERRSRGLVEAKKYSLPKAVELTLAAELKGERKANRKVRKMAEALLKRVQNAIESFAVNADFDVQPAGRFNGKRLLAKERTMVEEFEVNPLKATDLESLVNPHELNRTVLDKDGNKVKALKLNKDYTVEYTMVYAGPDVGTIETCIFPLGIYLAAAEGIS